MSSDDHRPDRDGNGAPGRTESWDGEPADAGHGPQLGPGSTLGSYEILDLLGAGGMGRVYLARDPQLKRQVALKVLDSQLTDQPELLERWRREAETVAALNHPNIVTIFTVEEVDEIRYFTMELVEGRSLDRVIPAEGLPLDELFEIAIPLIDALAAAHQRGVAHRDLKPANIMVSDEGWIKVLDFGLAKLLGDAARGDAPGQVTDTLTRKGLVLGTLPYMSPEQVQGKPVDLRTDIFSLGAVLYEMATGRRPFGGGSSAQLISAILRDQPSQVRALRTEAPQHLEWVIHRCLEKDPRRRYQSAIEVRNELAALRRELDSSPVSTTRPMAPVGGWSERLGIYSIRALWGLLLPAVILSGLLGKLALWGLSEQLDAQILDGGLLAGRPLFWAGSLLEQALATVVSPGALSLAGALGLLVLAANLLLLLARPDPVRAPPSAAAGDGPPLVRAYASLYHPLLLPLFCALGIYVFAAHLDAPWMLVPFMLLALGYLAYLVAHPGDLVRGGLSERTSYVVLGLAMIGWTLFVPYRYGHDFFDVQQPPVVERARRTAGAELESFERSGEMTVVLDPDSRVLATIQLSERGKLVSLSEVEAFEPRPQSRSLRELVSTIEEQELHDAKAIAGKWLSGS